MLTHLYQNPDDRDAIEDSRQRFEDVLFEQFGDGIPFVNGTDAWPVTVADAIIADRAGDGAGNPDGVVTSLCTFHSYVQSIKYSLSPVVRLLSVSESGVNW